MTSHDVVDFLRRLTGVKAGHTGTLDTAAAGLLVLCLGRATRLAQYLVGCDKTYWAEVCFGLATDSGDAEGRVVERASAERLTPERVAEALAGLTGTRHLRVPRYSAIKSGGRPLHRRARRGEAVEAPKREMRVDRWGLYEFLPGPVAVARTVLDCASGTYVRSLAQALAEALRMPAYLSFLVRTRVGQFHLNEACSLEETEQAARAERLDGMILPPAEAVSHLPAAELDEEQARRVAQGNAVEVEAAAAAAGGEPWRLLDREGRLVAVGRVTRDEARLLVRPETVIAQVQGNP
jgi:tRNA pseudouridine55 synthase